MSSERCENCAYWNYKDFLYISDCESKRSAEQMLVKCRRLPPDFNGKFSFSVWDDWCGEFKHRLAHANLQG
jgi:hypothetical protein